MKYEELVSYIQESKIFSHWHWFNYHFSFLVQGGVDPFAYSIVQACLDCEPHLPGFSKEFIDSLASIGGREKDRRQYEQLLQKLSELLVIRQIVTYPWPLTPKFICEPKVGASKKNPEISINYSELIIGVEVKMPSLLDHIDKRASNSWQISSRGPWLGTIKSIEPSEITLPRDNPILDFLKSANEKFKEFKKLETNFQSVLVIVWDDHIYEPISTLLAPNSGLFTEHSWATDEDGNKLLFENVDSVIIIPHMHQFIRAAGGRPLLDGKILALDYKNKGDYPFKAFISNPHGKGGSKLLIDCLEAYTPDDELGAEYIPSEVVHWV